MAVKKATVADTMAKVEAAAKKETPKAAEVKEPAKKAAAPKKEVTKKEVEPKKEVAKKEPVKKATPAKKTTTTAKKTTENVIIEFAGGQVNTADLVKKATEVSGKKSVKTLNVYYQPENGMVYYTADGEEGSFAL